MASLFQHQHKLLTDRNIDCMLGDWKTTLLLMLQAPIIAGLIAWRFYHVTPTTFLYFSMALSALWFGCTNAAREIVKERSILARERLFGLRLGAYLLAKVKVLCLLGLFQSLCLVVIVNYFVALKGFLGYHLVVAFFTTFAGIAMGLLLSSLVKSIHQSDALVPLVLIPQILFSPVVMPSRVLTGWAVYFETMLPLRWSYGAFSMLAEPSWKLLSWMRDIGILALMIAAMLCLTGLFIQRTQVEI